MSSQVTHLQVLQELDGAGIKQFDVPQPAPRRRLRQKTAPECAGVIQQMFLIISSEDFARREVALELRSNPGNQWLDTFLEHEDLAPEGNTHKAVYLVTLPHPTTAMTGGSSGLKAPGTLSRAQVLAIFQDVFAKPVHVDGAAPSRSGGTKHLIKVVVFQERHAENANGEREIHYHVTLCASSSFRFQPYERALRERHGLASHWSTSHHDYWSTVRYGWLPTPKKPSSELDPKPIAWNRDALTQTCLRQRRSQSLPKPQDAEGRSR